MRRDPADTRTIERRDDVIAAALVIVLLSVCAFAVVS